ncbi:heterokaryon incompatibility protein-domain-containing protein [Neurospora hispaniola]|uniref:Heterokaryon incompatibility protein-domain-containing protein n=1 Tax=Neurospora hispaniola TaxID=588809 RepID=A0AAJ0I4S5_9PEZI|nr:heterokaryon incompatibility protein-domain-containing protein [Neurospora hispaniola]
MKDSELLHLFDIDGSGMLVETSDMDKSERHGWCALSYVWGGDVPLKTTKATQLAHKKRIPLDTLPQTMKDAVYVCRGMAIRYLWIDALCIIQDDQEDLREEVSHMPKVYQYAALTISAASSRSIYDGFLYRRGYWSHTFPAIDIRVAPDSGESIRLFVYVIMYSHAFYKRKEPILQRAWTHDTYRLSSSRLWIDMVIEYSKREASFASDKLRALSAVARVYHLETGKEYLAGLWKEDIPAALCWASGPPPGESEAGQFVTSQRPREYRAPSWSWASVDTPVHYWGHRCNCAPVKPRPIQVLSAGIIPTYPNGEFDSIASGFLVLHGPIRAWALPTPIKLREFKTKDPTEWWWSIWVEEVNAYVYPDAIEDGHEMLDTLWFLLLAERDNNYHPDPGAREPSTTYYGLVLKEAIGHPNTFSRIGYFRTEAMFDADCDCSNRDEVYTSAMFFNYFEDRNITLI